MSWRGNSVLSKMTGRRMSVRSHILRIVQRTSRPRVRDRMTQGFLGSRASAMSAKHHFPHCHRQSWRAGMTNETRLRGPRSSNVKAAHDCTNCRGELMSSRRAEACSHPRPVGRAQPVADTYSSELKGAGSGNPFSFDRVQQGSGFGCFASP